MYKEQARYEQQLTAIGLKSSSSFTCTCYLDEVGNQPKMGDVLAWAESSAVVFANSVLGARCNRNSGMLDLFGSILGLVPEFGLLTDEGRQANWVIELKTTKCPEAQVLGSAIGLKVTESVPYVIGLDKYLGNSINDTTIGYLKDFGAATASNGAVGLYHIDNLTPEAVRLGHSLISPTAKKYVIDDAELDRVYASYPNMWKNPNAEPELCFIGCPHLTMTQLKGWTDAIVAGLAASGRRKVAVRTILTTAPAVLAKFKATADYARLIATGARLSSICPLMYTNNPLTKKKAIMTNSNKLRTYSISRYYLDKDILTKICSKEAR